jgi:hypothetical protein
VAVVVKHCDVVDLGYGRDEQIDWKRAAMLGPRS